MPSPFDELVASSRAQAFASTAWLGSEQHRSLLEGVLPSAFGLTGWKVIWLAPGSTSYSEAQTKTIAIERLTSGVAALADDDVAEYVALTLLHEALHARYSASAGAYKAMKAALHPAYHLGVEHLYQRIEDARLLRLAVAGEPSLEPHLHKFHDEGIRQREAQYLGKHGVAPWTTNPASQRDQLLLAIERRLFHPSDVLTIGPTVATQLAACEATIASAWAGTTETSGLTAIAVVEQIIAANLPS